MTRKIPPMICLNSVSISQKNGLNHYNALKRKTGKCVCVRFSKKFVCCGELYGEKETDQAHKRAEVGPGMCPSSIPLHPTSTLILFRRLDRFLTEQQLVFKQGFLTPHQTEQKRPKHFYSSFPWTRTCFYLTKKQKSVDFDSILGGYLTYHVEVIFLEFVYEVTKMLS